MLQPMLAWTKNKVFLFPKFLQVAILTFLCSLLVRPMIPRNDLNESQRRPGSSSRSRTMLLWRQGTTKPGSSSWGTVSLLPCTMSLSVAAASYKRIMFFKGLMHSLPLRVLGRFSHLTVTLVNLSWSAVPLVQIPQIVYCPTNCRVAVLLMDFNRMKQGTWSQ